jgi:hypothetical protein
MRVLTLIYGVHFVVLCCFAAAGVMTSAQCSQAIQQPAALRNTPPEPAAATEGQLVESSSGDAQSTQAASLRFGGNSAVTVLEETPLQVLSDESLSSKTAQTGARITFTVTRDVIVDGVLAIPCGAMIEGAVREVKQAGRLAGAPRLVLEFRALGMGGKSYPLYAAPFTVTGASNARPTERKIAVGAAAGAIALGAMPAERENLVGPSGQMKVLEPSAVRAIDAGIGATLGAGVGTAVAATSPRPVVSIPAESEIEFTLASPLAVFPVDRKEAARLARGMYRGGPVLYIRGDNQ